MSFLIRPQILCLAGLLLFAGFAQADTAILPTVQDNTLYEPIELDSFEDRSNGAGETMFTGRIKDVLNQSGQVAVRRGVLAAGFLRARRSTA